jgi:hypothetical protein
LSYSHLFTKASQFWLSSSHLFTKAGQFWLSSSHLRSISEQLLPNNAVLFNNKMQKLEYSQDRYF